MPKLVWIPEYELGITVIDKQHQRIVHYINQLYDIDDANKAAMQSLLSHLVDYTLSHFAFEESLLEDAEYEAFTEHQLIHENFSRLIENFNTRFTQGEPISQDLADALQRWLIQHILHEDSAYVPAVSAALLDIQHGQSFGWLQNRVRRFFQ